MPVSGRSETTQGFGQRWRSVATRSQPLGPGSPGERWWMVYTADIHQSEPDSVHCITLIGAMENTCGGGRAIPGNVAVTGSLRGRKLETGVDQGTSRNGSSRPFPQRSRTHGRRQQARNTPSEQSSRPERYPPRGTRALTLSWLTEPSVLFPVFPALGTDPHVFPLYLE